MRDFFHYDHLRLRYDPFPIGLARPLMEPADYRTLLAAWPAQDRFTALSKVGDKLTLSERFNGGQYRDLMTSDPFWRELHGWIKSDRFVRGVLAALAERNVDLGFDLAARPEVLLLRRLADAWRGGSRTSSLVLRPRFELSMMPARGGHILPHTDGVQKVVTLVVSVLEEGEWDHAWGGGTDVNRPKDDALLFNRRNAQLSFDDVVVLDTVAFEPNQAVLFVKTFNSLHSVRPMTAPERARMRRTLTINLEIPS
jgi:hypothetical protein